MRGRRLEKHEQNTVPRQREEAPALRQSDADGIDHTMEPPVEISIPYSLGYVEDFF